MIMHDVTINGIGVAAIYNNETVNRIFLPLMRQLTALQRKKGKRILAMLAAPPGTGKSTLLSFLDRLSRENAELSPVQTIGMDGFHRRQEYLMSHTVMRNGQEVRMVDIKGAPVTFDLEKLRERVKNVAAGEKCGWPVYDRMLHNPREDAVMIDSDNIVLLEGNYLLLDENGWRELAGYADYTISVSAEETFLRNRLIERRIKTGVKRDAAIRFVDFSDMPNVRTCLEKTMPADLKLFVDKDGDYHIR